MFKTDSDKIIKANLSKNAVDVFAIKSLLTKSSKLDFISVHKSNDQGRRVYFSVGTMFDWNSGLPNNTGVI